MPNGKRAYLSADRFDGKQIPVRSRSYLDSQGKIQWPKTGDGFVTDKAGNPITHPANLKAGQIIDRYGSSGGRFTSPVENGKVIPFNKRGLPYPEGYQDYHQYEVVKDITKENIMKSFNELPIEVQENMTKDLAFYGKSIEDLANIQQGEIARVFGAGGGIQIQLKSTVDIYEKLGLLREVIK